VEACTGVIRLKPKLDTASSIQSDNAGVSASQALVAPLSLLTGAILIFLDLLQLRGSCILNIL
jgi:hypothetical protein